MEEEKINNPEYERIDNCPNCKCKTIQVQILFYPDADEDNKMFVWACSKCNESLEIV